MLDPFDLLPRDALIAIIIGAAVVAAVAVFGPKADP